MSNGTNGLFAFIEQGTDPRLPPGFDAPANAICTFEGEVLLKTGDGATDWEERTAAFTGGSVSGPTSFGSPVQFQAPVAFGSSGAFTGEVTFEGGARIGNLAEISGGTVLFRGPTTFEAPATFDDDIDTAADLRVGGLVTVDAALTVGAGLGVTGDGDFSGDGNFGGDGHFAGDGHFGGVGHFVGIEVSTAFKANAVGVGFYGHAPIVGPGPAIPNATAGPATLARDDQARAAVNGVLRVLRNLGIILP